MADSVEKSVVALHILNGSEIWTIRKENEMELQQQEMRMVRWMCDKIKFQVKS